MRQGRWARLVLGSALLLLMLWGCGGQGYHERYVIVFGEERLPCFGVTRLKIQITGDSVDAVKREYIKPIFWRESDGKCDLRDGLVIKQIPFGGTRRVMLEGFDSTDLMVAKGTSPPFQVDPEGESPGTIQLTFSRLGKVDLGTLVLSFPKDKKLDGKTRTLVLVIPQSKGNPYTRVIPVTAVDNLPAALVITGIPAAEGKDFTVSAQDASGKDLQRWQGRYSIRTDSSKKAFQRVELTLSEKK